ncbi:hypothetical protein GP475_04385 [Corynebacterium poyangense]|uniref:Histidine kinase domain-containing protein n=2 Tax=Corynebacterium poyangense TaxID=2684405 RepID=A0A7H0SN40_9CORY|nr:hypothetical protein GP475_04385 [Corynebacterium poyangense]
MNLRVRTQRKPYGSFNLSNMALAGIWLPFLLIPIWSRLQEPSTPLSLRVVGAAITAAFIAVYLFAFGVRYSQTWSPTQRWPLLLGILVALSVLSMWPLGAHAIAFTPFLCALPCFVAPLSFAIPWTLFLIATISCIAWISYSSQTLSVWPFIFSCLFVLVVALFSRHDEKLTEVQHQLDMVKERERIALDVHDLLGHSLTVINLKSELLKHLIETDLQASRRELEDIILLSRKALTEVRSTVTQLHSPDFSQAIEATKQALDAAAISYRLPTQPAVVGTNGALFSWVLREATTNIVRHAQASHVDIRVTADKLQISDDGVGIDHDERKGGNGLTSMNERVAAAGGTVAIEAAPGGGTRVFVTMSGNKERLGDD